MTWKNVLGYVVNIILPKGKQTISENEKESQVWGGKIYNSSTYKMEAGESVFLRQKENLRTAWENKTDSGNKEQNKETKNQVSLKTSQKITNKLETFGV